MKIAHFVPIRYQTWPPQANLKSKKSSETTLPNEPKRGWKHLWKILYKVSSKQNERWADTGSAHWASSLWEDCMKSASYKAERRSTIGSHIDADSVEKHVRQTNIYVVNQKLQHFDEISFR